MKVKKLPKKETTNRRQQILAIAAARFSQDGYDKVTLKQIALECGITEPAVYKYYPTKAALYQAVIDRLLDNWDDKQVLIKLSTEDDVEKLLKTLAKHILNAYCDNEDICRLLLYSTLRNRTAAQPVFDAIRGKYVQFLTKQLNRLHRTGWIIKRNNIITARCFVGMVFECAMGFCLWSDFQGKSYPPDKIVANNIPIYARGLRIDP